MIEVFCSLSFLIFGGNIIYSKLAHHKYDRENHKKIFYLKNKQAVDVYCVKHSEFEKVKKVKYYHHNNGQKIKYKID